VARVSRRAKGPRLQLRDDEVLVITGLLDELGGLLGDDPAEVAPGDLLAGLSWPDSEPVTAPTDPALLRLLPDAYREDPEAAAEFRRYTEATLRDDMAADLHVVRLTLSTVSENGHATLDDDTTQAWLRVLNRVRLVLAVRLGIEAADDHEALGSLDDEDPRVGPYLLFEWVGYVLSDLLRAAF
jgi:phytoene dehydrogenase-like protein